MHTDLSPHLHTPECNKIISELYECRKNNSFAKFIGFCNQFDSELTRCLKQERLTRRDANRKSSKEHHEKHQERMREKLKLPISA